MQRRVGLVFKNLYGRPRITKEAKATRSNQFIIAYFF